MHSQTTPLILAANIGIMLFFTIAVAPTIFTVLPAEWAAKYVRAFFPKYYAVLGITTAIAAVLSATPMYRFALVGCAFFFFFSDACTYSVFDRKRGSTESVPKFCVK